MLGELCAVDVVSCVYIYVTIESEISGTCSFITVLTFCFCVTFVWIRPE